METFKAGEWEQGQALWTELLGQGVNEVAPFKEAMKELWRRGQQKLGLELLNLTAQTYAESGKPKLWLDALRLLSEYNPADRNLIKNYTDAFLKAHSDRPYLAEWITKVPTKNISAPKYIEILDKLVLFKENSIIKHRSGWGIGKVISIDHEKMEMMIDLQHHHNHRIEVLAASDCLTPLADDNFEALLVFQPEFLKEEAHQKPLELLYRVLKFHKDPITSRELKEYICPAIIEQKDWNKWWTRARKLLIADPYIETGDSVHAKYSLRMEPMEWENEIRAHFDSVQDLVEKTGIILDYLKTSDKSQNLKYFSATLAHACSAHLAKGKPWYAFESYLVLELCREKDPTIDTKANVSLETIVKGHAVAIFNNLRLPALAQQTLDMLLKYEPTWESHVEQIFKKSSDLGRDTLYKYLNKQNILEKHLHRICREIFSDPLGSPDALIWFARQSFANKIPTFPNIPTFFEVLQMLISAGGTLKALRQVETVKKITKIFSLNLAKKIVETINNEQASQLFKALDESNFLPYTFRQTLQDTLRERFTDLFSQVQTIYTTKAGLSKYERELQDLIQNKFEQNRKAIGEAIAFGDLSENAELDAAREIQWQLTSKAKEMQKNIARAALIDFNTVDVNRISIGTKATLQDADGKKTTYTILGPWDVNLEKGVISFMSEIAKKLLGARKNETVDLPAGKFRVVEIEKFEEEPEVVHAT